MNRNQSKVEKGQELELTPNAEIRTRETGASWQDSAGGTTQVAYHEMSDRPVHFVDPVSEVQKNLAHLEEIQSRLKFMMREIRYLMKA